MKTTNEPPQIPRNLNIHDQTFCYTVGLRPVYAQDIIKLGVDAETLNSGAIDLSSIQRENSALRSPNKNKPLALTDMAYSIRVQSLEQKVLVPLLLFEHKSYKDPGAPLQIATQTILAYNTHSYVVPFLISQGGEEMGQYIIDPARPVFGLTEVHSPYVAVHINDIPDSRLIEGDLTAAPVWATMKYREALEGSKAAGSKIEEATKVVFKSLRRCVPPYRTELFSISGGYMFKLNPALDLPTLRSLEQKTIEPGEEEIVNEIMEFDPVKARQLGHNEGRQEGLKQGLQQGIQQGIQKGVQKGVQQGVQQGLQQGVQQGIQQGVQQGFLQGQQGIVLNLLEQFPPEQVAQMTKVPLNEVLKAKKA